jgi:tetratricopeptide (TPR) repeat protein
MGRAGGALTDPARAGDLAPGAVPDIPRLTHLLTDRYEEALSEFNSLIQHDPSAAWALRGRGLAYLLMDREDDALADFSRAIELDSAAAAAYLCRGLVYEARGHEEDAATDYGRAIELEPAISDMLGSLRSEIVRR